MNVVDTSHVTCCRFLLLLLISGIISPPGTEVVALFVASIVESNSPTAVVVTGIRVVRNSFTAGVFNGICGGLYQGGIGAALGWSDPVGWLDSVGLVSVRRRIVMPVAGVVVVLVAVGLLLGSDVVSDEVARAMEPTVVPTVGVVLRDPLGGLCRGMAPDAVGLASGGLAGGVPRRGFVMVALFDEYDTNTITDGDGGGWSYTYGSDLYGGCAHLRAPRLVAWPLDIRAEGEEEKFFS